MRRILLLSMVVISAFPSAILAGEKTDWFRNAHWGVMTHYLGAPPSSSGGAELTAEMWNRQIDAVDVEGLADQVASTGARYLLFTLGQNSGHYCSPNTTYDKIVGITPSKCSRRDLISDLAKALKARSVKLMVYLPSGAPAADPVARKKLGWRWGRTGGWQLPGEPVGGRLAEFQRHWEAVIREWSLRWGENVAGWWIDGCYFPDQMYRFDDGPNFATFAAAMRAGNPDAIVAFNPGVRVPVVAHFWFAAGIASGADIPQTPRIDSVVPSPVQPQASDPAVIWYDDFDGPEKTYTESQGGLDDKVAFGGNGRSMLTLYEKDTCVGGRFTSRVLSCWCHSSAATPQ